MMSLAPQQLLGRPPLAFDTDRIGAFFAAKRVLVTGAGGSIGAEICRQLGVFGCAHLSLLENSELALFEIDSELAHRFPLLSRRSVFCDIRQEGRLRGWVEAEAPDVVIHSAALKHVTVCEEFPCEALLTNVTGTLHVMRAALAAKVPHVVLVSSDKAVEPAGVMGASKCVAEAIFRRERRLATSSRLSVVRLGNVLASSGSAAAIFERQIARGGPVTVTDRMAERLFMSVEEAALATLDAAARSGDFVPRLEHQQNILDLVTQMIAAAGKTGAIEIQIGALRSGEKRTESLLWMGETATEAGGDLLKVADAMPKFVSDDDLDELHSVAERGNNAEALQTLKRTLATITRGA